MNLLINNVITKNAKADFLTFLPEMWTRKTGFGTLFHTIKSSKNSFHESYMFKGN
jgi:hypothetical protein